MRKSLEVREISLKADALDQNTQRCPVCSNVMGIMPGMRDAVCKNCGYKDPCCE